MYSPGQPQLPHQPPFVVQAAVTQQFQQFLPLATGMAMMMAMQSANVSPFRNAYVGNISQNNWQNPMFEQLAKMTAQLGEVLAATQRLPVEQALQAAADQCLQMLTAAFVHQNHSVFPQLADPGTAQAIQNLLQKLQGVGDQVARYYQHLNTAAPAMGYGGGAPGYGGMPGYGAGAPPMGYQNSFLTQQRQGLGAGALGFRTATETPAAPTNFSNPYNEPTSYSRYGHEPKETKTPGFSSPLNIRDDNKTVPGYRRANAEETRRTGVLEELSMDAVPETKLEPLRPRSGGALREQPVAAPAASPRRDLPEVTPVRPVNEEVLPTKPKIDPLKTTVQTEVTEWFSLKALGEWPKVANPERPWDAVLLVNGDELRPAHLSPWKVSRTEQPYQLAFDPGSQIKFHIRHKETGEVTETILQWEESMDYLEHELDREARARHRMSRDRNENVAVDMGKINRLRQVDNAPIAAVDPVEEANPENIGTDVQFSVVESGIRAWNFGEAQKRVQIKLAANKVDPNEPYEYYVDLMHTLVCKKETVEALDAAVNAKSPEKTVELVKSIEEKDVLEVVNRMMTDRVNQVVNNMLGVSWKITSFVEDYLDLVKELRTTYGDFVADQLIERHDGIVGAGLPLQTEGSGFDYAMEKLGLNAEELDLAGMRLAVFQERVSATALPWKLEDLQVQLSREAPSLVDETKLPNLHRCMESILKRSLDFPVPYRHHYILLDEGVVLELYKGYLIEDSILLRISDIAEKPTP